MASGSPTLPPAALSQAQAQARADQIAVRIINLPDGLRDNPSPVKISGTVAGQNPDGTLDINTDLGRMRILLKDRGNIPQGGKIDIEIPAGRSPQQAHIRQSDPTPPQTQDQPSLTRTITAQPPAIPQSSAQTTPPANQLAQNTKLNIETMSAIITASQNQIIEEAPIPIPIAGGALQAGQITRLLPVPPGSLPPQVLASLTTPSPLPILIAGLVQSIETLPKDQAQIRTTLITILSRLDLSSLVQTPQQPKTQAVTAQNSNSHAQLLEKIGALLQSIGMPANFKNETPSPQAPTLPSSFGVFNPSKPIDGQVLAFQTAPAPHTTEPILSVIQQSVKIASLQSSPIAAGQVLGFNDAKLPLLSVPLPSTGLTQIYTMQFGANNLSAGAPVFIALDPLSIRPTQTLFTQSADGSLTINSSVLKSGMGGWINPEGWDALDSLLKTLLHSAPQQGQGLAQMIPSPAQPHNMGALSLFFLAMMRSGDTDGWVGTEATALLRQMGKLDVLRAASTDLTLASKIDGLTLPQDWRVTMIPLLWDNHIQKTPLYYKHLPDDSEKEANDAKKRRKLRFLFDLNLSRMGGVQVDGFMQSERLDIILRTKSPLSPPMQSQMKKIYAGAMDKSRLTGDISFQFKPEHWVDFSQNFEKAGVNA